MAILWSSLQLMGAVLFLYISVLSWLGHILPDDIARDLGYRHGEWVRNLITEDANDSASNN